MSGLLNELFGVNPAPRSGGARSCRRPSASQRNTSATLEPGISENQTNQMTNEGVQLVVPTTVFPSYTDTQRSRMLNVGGFIELVRSRQA